MPSVDVVSRVDDQEVRNAVDQSMREIVNRYDFKGTNTTVALTDEGITVEVDGKTITVCCHDCATKIQADSEKYLKAR